MADRTYGYADITGLYYSFGRVGRPLARCDAQDGVGQRRRGHFAAGGRRRRCVRRSGVVERITFPLIGGLTMIEKIVNIIGVAIMSVVGIGAIGVVAMIIKTWGIDLD